MSEVKLTGLKDVVAWLECQPQWSGVAVRRVDEPPIPGEPFISMESAKLLVVSAVSIMDNRSFEAVTRIEALEKALKPFALQIENVHKKDKDEWSIIDQAWQHPSGVFLTIGDLRRAARAYANKGEQ